MATQRCLYVLLFCLIPLMVPSAARSAGLSPATQSEIGHLLDFVEKSGCQGYRNGTWYKDGKAVREHMERKYSYFMDKGRIGSTEDFIRWAATKSEMSGKPYLVKCDNGPEQPTSHWLITELERFRKGR